MFDLNAALLISRLCYPSQARHEISFGIRGSDLQNEGVGGGRPYIARSINAESMNAYITLACLPMFLIIYMKPVLSIDISERSMSMRSTQAVGYTRCYFEWS